MQSSGIDSATMASAQTMTGAAFAATSQTATLGEHAAARGEALYNEGMYCCETVLTVVNEVAGDKLPPEIMSLGSGFWGGMAGDGSTCGALVGAIMSVGLLAGRTGIDGPWEPSSTAIEELRRTFAAAHGDTSCSHLVGRFGGMCGEGRHNHCARLTGLTAAMVVAIAEERGWL